ncbi:MAG TPA: hypothetical protein VGR32_06325 [Brevundimonas sp.]|jgi:hypothetical protein|uniref:hypothetical protein n=1 Tax=Brevundimonas sp. TaxID=1871086 RepID=UPI002DEF6B7E|nr:hypothetical protein [Brevundimonas sp.]
MLIALTLAAALASTPQATLTQADYNAFKRCQGDYLGHYRAGVRIFGGTQFEANVQEVHLAMHDLLIEIDDALQATGVRLDWQAGYSVYISSYQQWGDFPNRRDAEDLWFDRAPMTPQCAAAIDRVAAFVDAN